MKPVLAIFTVIGPIIWCDNPQVRMWKILYTNNNYFHHLGRSQMCAGACYYFSPSKPHSGTLWLATQFITPIINSLVRSSCCIDTMFADNSIPQNCVDPVPDSRHHTEAGLIPTLFFLRGHVSVPRCEAFPRSRGQNPNEDVLIALFVCKWSTTVTLQ